MTNCEYSCNSSQYCGGWNSIYVFDTHTITPLTVYNTSSSSYQGCFNDAGKDGRIMAGLSHQDFSKNTINMCTQFFSLNGKFFAGLEYGLILKELYLIEIYFHNKVTVLS